MKVYIAGPYTASKDSVAPIAEVEQNVYNAMKMGNTVLVHEHEPYIPHLYHYWNLNFPHHYNLWIDLNLRWLAVCQALIRLPGESKGADIEVEEANKLGIPVYRSFEEFLQSVGTGKI